MVSEGGSLRPCFFLVIEFLKVIKVEGEKKKGGYPKVVMKESSF